MSQTCAEKKTPVCSVEPRRPFSLRRRRCVHPSLSCRRQYTGQRGRQISDKVRQQLPHELVWQSRCPPDSAVAFQARRTFLLLLAIMAESPGKFSNGKGHSGSGQTGRCVNDKVRKQFAREFVWYALCTSQQEGLRTRREERSSYCSMFRSVAQEIPARKRLPRQCFFSDTVTRGN